MPANAKNWSGSTTKLPVFDAPTPCPTHGPMRFASAMRSSAPGEVSSAEDGRADATALRCSASSAVKSAKGVAILAKEAGGYAK